jgi:hypothetical protein
MSYAEGDWVVYYGDYLGGPTGTLYGTVCQVQDFRTNSGEVTLGYLWYNDRIHSLDAARFSAKQSDVVKLEIPDPPKPPELPDGYYFNKRTGEVFTRTGAVWYYWSVPHGDWKFLQDGDEGISKDCFLRIGRLGNG